MNAKHPPNSRLVKYARRSAETFSVSISTKITPSMNEAFLRVCQALNLSPAEVLRYLIAEELKVWEPIWNLKENEVATAKETIVDHKETNRNQKSSNQQTPNPLKVNGQMPCPLCQTWHDNIAAHLKRSHKTNKKAVFSDPEYKEIAEQMAQAALNKQKP